MAGLEMASEEEEGLEVLLTLSSSSRPSSLRASNRGIQINIMIMAQTSHLLVCFLQNPSAAVIEAEEPRFTVIAIRGWASDDLNRR